ncbi:hypothetical protein Phum_PHUM293840 [Pediculus humanus corporis]|uniref:Uncharacterized protein n=1 Tax=Pediculus humanus subsp. corporis TaxID=121224 RepID=E0VLT8_PEDHC|nr:uncharacterized protein Phum_PHUM293840 [Pediculus humanus corporis]EEB14344.1 hypothetical protein Phum_PHUM293840 [Pediculus humanus corporis]
MNPMEKRMMLWRKKKKRAKDGGDDDAIPNHGIITKSVNIFKLDRNEDILPVLTNFDPFTAIEEDSEDCSNPLTNSDILNSPADESPFSQSLEKTKDWENAGEPTLKIIEETNAESNDVVIVNKSNDVMRKLFTQTISNENSDDFTEQNYEQENDEEGSKLCVDESMNAARSQNNFITPNPSSFVSIDKIEVDEFFSSEDILKDDEGEIEDLSNGKTREEGKHDKNGVWTTVEEVLKAQPENFELEGDSGYVNVTNECDDNNKNNNIVNNSTKDDFVGLTDSQVNGFSDSGSELFA